MEEFYSHFVHIPYWWVLRRPRKWSTQLSEVGDDSAVQTIYAGIAGIEPYSLFRALAYGPIRESLETRCGILGSESVITTSSFNMAISLFVLSVTRCFDDEVIASPMACLAPTRRTLQAV